MLIALPYTRNPGRVVARFGFVPDGEVNYGGTTFRQYRLDRNAWLDRCSSSCADTPRELIGKQVTVKREVTTVRRRR
ncbi:MAG TPA: hypothetical protein VM429_11260 [Micropruina sp.]|nr:hypothetical protein [Micropruina sp.]